MNTTQPASPRYQVFVIGPNDWLRTSAGDVRIYDTIAAAQAAAATAGGFVQTAGAAAPGGFDRTFG